MSAVITVVETETTYPFEALWREFPELDRSTCVGRMSYSGNEHWGVVRTFRLLDGNYLRVHSWGRKDGVARNVIEDIPAEELAVYEGVWRTMLCLGRLYDMEDQADELTGIRAASHEYMLAVDEKLDGCDNEDHLDDGEEDTRD